MMLSQRAGSMVEALKIVVYASVVQNAQGSDEEDALDAEDGPVSAVYQNTVVDEMKFQAQDLEDSRKKLSETQSLLAIDTADFRHSRKGQSSTRRHQARLPSEGPRIRGCHTESY